MAAETTRVPLEAHLFTMKGQSFVLDVEGNRLYAVSPEAYRQAGELLDGKSVSPATYAEWTAKKEIDSLLASIAANAGKRGALEKEYTQPDPQPPEIVGLWLGLAHACNLACSYCFANEPNYVQRNALMSWDTAKAAVDFLLKNSPGREEYEIIFFGGEPLLRFDVLRRVVEYCEGIRKTGKKFLYSITTNGTLLTPGTYEYLAAHDVSIMLSIDGTQALHDRNRRYRNGAPSWDDIIANLHQIPDFGSRIAARVTVPNTEVPLLEIYRTMKGIGFHDIALIEVCPNSGELPMFPQAEIARWKEQHLELAEHILATEPDAYRSELNSIVGYARSLREGARSFYCCGTGIHYFYVTPQGDCYPCMRLITHDERNKMGTIYSAIDREAVERFRSNHIFGRACRDCWARYQCGGMCYGDSFALTGDIKAPVSVFCEITRHKIEVSAYLLWKLKQEGRLPEGKKGWLRERLSQLAGFLKTGGETASPKG